MRLKQIKLAGFKSFVDSTKIPFLHNITAVVGPNGCGKSNTIDAVRWVLGESSAKNLRGNAMTDVIFNGSTARRPISVASVELIFENLDGRLGGQYASYQEIAIKRQVTRDAENTYFLNGVKCRRKDITDVFMGTGLGPRSYAIIEQGTISRLIESKPQDLRVFIEEAAGISRYKERRKDTENRIRHTRDNLLRLTDIRLELGTQLDKLEEQAASAKIYREYKQQERKTHAELLVMRYQDIIDQAKMVSADISVQELGLSKLSSSKEQTSSRFIEQKLKIQTLDTEEQSQVEVFYQTGTKVAKLEQQLLNEQQKDERTEQTKSKIIFQQNEYQQKLSVCLEKECEIKASIDPIIPSLELLKETQEELVVIQEELTAKYAIANAELASVRESLSDKNLQLGLSVNKKQFSEQSLQNKEKQLDEINLPLSELSRGINTNIVDDIANDIAAINDQKKTQETSFKSIENNIQLLDKQIKQLDHEYAELKQKKVSLLSRKELIEQWIEKGTGGKEIQKLWQNIDVKAGWETAVELLLSNMMMEPVITDNNALAENAFGFELNLASISDETLKTNANISPWLNGVHWAKDNIEANEMLTSLLPNERIITADGHIVGHGFVLKPKQKESSMIALQHELETLTDEIIKIEIKLGTQEKILAPLKMEIAELITQKNKYSNQITELTIALNSAMKDKKNAVQRIQEKSTLLSKLNQQQQNLSDDILSLKTNIQSCTNEVEVIDSLKTELTEQIENKTQNLTSLKHQQQNISSQLKDVLEKCQQQEKQHTQLNYELTLCRQEITQINSRLEELAEAKKELNGGGGEQNTSQQHVSDKLKKELELLLHAQQQQQQRLNLTRLQQKEWQKQLDNSLFQQKQEVAKIEKQLKVIANLKLRREGMKGQSDSQLQLLDESQINQEEVAANITPDANVDMWQQQLDKLRAKISHLGAINLAAIEEYDQQNERKQYLDAQNDDLHKALQSLEQAIRKIDKETRIRFKTTFEQINADFNSLFPKVFGGGKAYLALTDDDLLETGVSIMAQPPGKKNSTIHLLSGGEKALTALSLVFAIFRLNPAPFCMLDEVDAPLDDANVERFCRLLKEMSQTVQFIYISHNKITMEMADQLIGVTMHEPGVSRIVAVDLEEAVAMADAV